MSRSFQTTFNYNSPLSMRTNFNLGRIEAKTKMYNNTI